ncbi:MAG TPA: neutral/alkaline non-lysosomal ceramidase N-terminal domain-containing protein [Dehalococcoidia bacterium]|nr:neutral/alkaline non-lysosomal ceramidase N-terminal domain-containing protein [Dehalococcoidia bacterium]
MSSLRAGAAVVDITPPVGGPMDGYGGRFEGSQGVHDALMARVVVIEQAGEEGGASPAPTRVAIVSCDLLGMHREITTRLRERASALGVAPEGVLVATTHNHAGPHGLRGGMFSRLNEDLAAALVDKVSAAIAEAVSALRPATPSVRKAYVDSVSMNRRDPAWPIDPIMRLALLDGEDGPVASILNFACHGTVLSGKNMMLSGEFPGAASRLLLEQTGAPCVYLNGACGNVNPVWVKQDFDSVQRVGQVIGGQALRMIGEMRTLVPGQRVHNIRWDEFPEKPVPGRVVEPRLRAVREEIELPVRPFATDEAYAGQSSDLEAQAAPLPEGSAERREIMAQLSRVQNERWAAAWARQKGGTSQRTELQAISLGEGLALLALPGEFFVETGEKIRRAAAQGWGPEPRGISDLFLACYANDYIGYVVPAEAYEQGGYEPGVTFCPPEAEAAVIGASTRLLQRVATGE